MPADRLAHWLASSYLAGTNQSWAEQLYQTYLADPTAVPPEWQAVFQQLTERTPSARTAPVYAEQRHLIWRLVDAYRRLGHYNARLDPLGEWRPRADLAELTPTCYGLDALLSADERIDSDLCGQPGLMTLTALQARLQAIYCGSLGVEFMHTDDAEQQRWFQQRLEPLAGHYPFSATEQCRLLETLTAAEALEHHLSARFPGVKRFSLEGADAFLPLLYEALRYASQAGVNYVELGMAHRGRLNVLVNLLGYTMTHVSALFRGEAPNTAGSGDVKYHLGGSATLTFGAQHPLHLALAWNPSHLEIVNPVVMGAARARQDQHPLADRCAVLPIMVHGDAALAGQGVVQETLNMSQTRGFAVGGALHIVINNQIGFTTSAQDDARSSPYCTDIAKMIQAPVLHVNGDDPQAVVFAARLALEYRQTFRRDIFLDLVCYRRHGHNEADDPAVTQPLRYQRIKTHPSVRQRYAAQLIAEGVITEQAARALLSQCRAVLERGDSPLTARQYDSVQITDHASSPPQYDAPTPLAAPPLNTLAAQIAALPPALNVHPRVRRIYQDRQQMARGERPFDWGAAEMLAYASLLQAGVNLRLSGEDVRRGTFFHRHAAVYAQTENTVWLPLEHLPDRRGRVEIWDSVLSEEAALAFEYGYAITAPHTLTLWEAQFGDFANGAQVVIDQFLSAGEQKWNQRCGLTLLLPHGYEGQGPEHSSARPERWLQLCAEENLRICAPTTPAQIYHLLRQQALNARRCPLIVMTPKSLLRHPLAVSPLSALTDGDFFPVLADDALTDGAAVRRVIVCSGKIYYDLLEQRQRQDNRQVALIRLEQLYPFPQQALHDQLQRYPQATEWVWCQEEPHNQGAWLTCQPALRALLPPGVTLRYAGRAASAAPATGQPAEHKRQQQAVLDAALCMNS